MYDKYLAKVADRFAFKPLSSNHFSSVVADVGCSLICLVTEKKNNNRHPTARIILIYFYNIIEEIRKITEGMVQVPKAG